MRKFVLLLAILGLALSGLPAIAQDGGCMLEPPAEAVQINVIGWTFPIMDFYASEMESCNQVENVDVNVQMLQSADAQNEMRLAASSTGVSPYDIVFGSDAFIGELASLGWLMPLNDLIAEYSDAYDLGDMSDAMYAAASVGDNRYGIPVNVNTQVFFYNTELLAAAGVEPPQTYDDVIAVCNSGALIDAGADMNFGTVVSAGWAWRIEWVNIFGSYGGKTLGAEPDAGLQQRGRCGRAGQADGSGRCPASARKASCSPPMTCRPASPTAASPWRISGPAALP